MSEDMYSFQIQTSKNNQDEKSPYLLAKFEFLALNIIEAEKYRESLIKHYQEIKLCHSVIGYDYTDIELLEN